MHFFTQRVSASVRAVGPVPRRGAPIRQISYRSLALWDDDLPERPYELSVLMEIDLGTKTLKGAWLAAVDWGKETRADKSTTRGDFSSSYGRAERWPKWRSDPAHARRLSSFGRFQRPSGRW